MTVSKVSNKEEHETATRPTTEKGIMTPRFSRKEEMDTNFSSTETKVRKSHTLIPYIHLAEGSGIICKKG